jgi:hypothetical protein
MNMASRGEMILTGDYGWRRSHPDIEGNYEYTEKAVVDSQKGW